MTDAFRQLCAEVYDATVHESSYEKCCPEYQRVLDYILSHPDERDGIATELDRCVRYGWQSGGIRYQIYMVQFLMETLKWPEIRAAAEYAMTVGGPAWLDYKHLLELYAVA